MISIEYGINCVILKYIPDDDYSDFGRFMFAHEDTLEKTRFEN